MDEMNTNAEMTEEVISDTELSAFDDSWDDITPDEGDFDLTGGEETDTEEVETESETGDPDEGAEAQPEAETTEDAEDTADTPKEDEKGAEGHQLYTLKSPAGEKQCSLDEVLALANKGMDYDGVKQDRDRMREFLKELAAPSGYTIEELMDTTRARMLMSRKKAEGVEMSEMDALTEIQRNRAAAVAEGQHKAETQKQEMINTFLAEFPNVKAADIPQEVWQACRETGDLAGAYRKYANSQKDSEITRLKQELETLKLNQKNKDRSTGSRKSAGATTPKDPFDEGWDSV